MNYLEIFFDFFHKGVVPKDEIRATSTYRLWFLERVNAGTEFEREEPLNVPDEEDEGGEDLEDFLDGFPSVSRAQAEAFLQIALESALAEDNARAA